MLANPWFKSFFTHPSSYPSNTTTHNHHDIIHIFRVKDLELEITRMRIENEALKKAALAAGANPMSVAKVIQPTATVSSVPVSGPSE
jgi:hypothetical protein